MGSPPLDVVGVESDLMALLTNNTGGFVVRAKFRLTAPRPPEALPEGDALDVVISARVFEELTGAGVPVVPHAQGPEVRRTARVNEWSVVDLELPPVLLRSDGYFVHAKVYPRDERYRKNFEPAQCYVRRLQYGFAPA